MGYGSKVCINKIALPNAVVCSQAYHALLIEGEHAVQVHYLLQTVAEVNPTVGGIIPVQDPASGSRVSFVQIALGKCYGIRCILLVSGQEETSYTMRFHIALPIGDSQSIVQFLPAGSVVLRTPETSCIAVAYPYLVLPERVNGNPVGNAVCHLVRNRILLERGAGIHGIEETSPSGYYYLVRIGA